MNKDVKAIMEAVIDRSAAQKELRIAKMRAELAGMGMSVVSTIWLDAVTRHKQPAELA